MLKELLLSIGLSCAIGVGGVVQGNDHTPSRTIYPYSDFVSFSYDDEKSTDVSHRIFYSNTNGGVIIHRNYGDINFGGGSVNIDSANLSVYFPTSAFEDSDWMETYSPYRLSALPQINLNMGNNLNPNILTFYAFPLFEIVPYSTFPNYSSNNSCCVWFAYHLGPSVTHGYEMCYFATFFVCNDNGKFNYYFNDSNPLFNLNITCMSLHYDNNNGECEVDSSYFYVSTTDNVTDTFLVTRRMITIDYLDWDDMVNFNFSFNLPNITNDADYQRGYDDGKQVGYQDGYNQGENAGYQNGVTDGQNLGNTLGGLFTTIADIPIRMIHSMTNFDLFGVSLFVGIMSLATLSIVVFVIKKVV